MPSSPSPGFSRPLGHDTVVQGVHCSTHMETDCVCRCKIGIHPLRRVVISEREERQKPLASVPATCERPLKPFTRQCCCAQASGVAKRPPPTSADSSLRRFIGFTSGTILYTVVTGVELRVSSLPQQDSVLEECPPPVVEMDEWEDCGSQHPLHLYSSLASPRLTRGRRLLVGSLGRP